MHVAIAIQSTPTLRTNLKIIDPKIGRSNPNRKLEFVAASNNLDNVEPQEENFHADTSEARKPVFGNVATNGGFVFELVRTFQRETTRTVQISVEFATACVEIVARDALWEEAFREIVGLEDFIGGECFAAVCGGDWWWGCGGREEENREGEKDNLRN